MPDVDGVEGDQSLSGRGAAHAREESVMSVAVQLLKDHATIGAVLHEAGCSAQDLVGALKSIDAHRLRLESDGESAKAMARAIQRIDLRRNGFELTLDLKPLVADQLIVRDGAPDEALGLEWISARFVPLSVWRWIGFSAKRLLHRANAVWLAKLVRPLMMVLDQDPELLRVEKPCRQPPRRAARNY